jgi:hypothetical protein
MSIAEPVEAGDLQTDNAPYIPTPEEIAAGCAAIRAGWSPSEELSRRVFRPETVETRTVREMVD